MTIGSISYNQHTSDYVYASKGRLREIQNDAVIERKQRLASQFQAVEKARTANVETIRLEELIAQIRLRENTSDVSIRFEDQLSRLGFSDAGSYESYYVNDLYRTQQQIQSYHSPYLSLFA